MDTTGFTTESHLLVADLQTSAGSYLEIRRPVLVTNPQVAVSIAGFSSKHIDVVATSASI